MTERIVEEWIVILDDGKEREELMMRTCPGLYLDYGGIRWKRHRASPLKIAMYYPSATS